MKQVKIKRLSLRNFKGIKHFSIDFENETTRIYGDNATGKTTLVDAFTWLLFGKDSTERKDFSIKNFDSYNNVEHKLEHEVIGAFDIDGEEMILKRIYKEKWVTRRGSSEPELQGHETIFFWNDVPMQAGEYQSKVDQIISEQTFKMITSPFYFNSLKWQERRNILTSIAGDVSDEGIALSSPQFRALLDSMGKKTLEEYKKELAAKKKRLKDQLKEIPARIDEVSNNIPEAKDWAWIDDEIKTVEKNIAIIDSQLEDSSKVFEQFYERKQELQNKIHTLKTKVSDIEHEGRQKFNKNVKEKSDAISDAKVEIEKINRKIASNVYEVKRLNDLIIGWEAKQDELRKEWEKVNETVYQDVSADGDFVCPTCSQQLPEEVINAKKDQFRTNFNKNKESQLSEISEQGQGFSKKIANTKAEIDFIGSVDYEAQIKQHENAIKEWEGKHLESVQAILSNDLVYQAAKHELEEIEKQPTEEAPTVDNTELKTKKKELQTTLDSLKRDLALKNQIDQGEKRKQELLSEEKKYSQQLAELEQSEFTIQEFTQKKVDMLESKINQLFKGVKFRLFDTQLNGGLIECCDTLIDGVPWADANNAARINAGISIINVLSSHYGQIAPIWIDNAESITSIQHTDSQKIELYVSESHKQLEVA